MANFCGGNQFFINNQDGTFVERAGVLGVRNPGQTTVVAGGDFLNEATPAIFLGRWNIQNLLYVPVFDEEGSVSRYRETALPLGMATSGQTLAAMLSSATAEQLALAGAIGGLVGDAIGGAISGGVRGAFLGALFGFTGGALFGGVGKLLADVAGKLVSFAVLTGVGASLSYATGGWKGLITFGVGFVGGFVGSRAGFAMARKSNVQFQMPSNELHFEYGNDQMGKPPAATE